MNPGHSGLLQLQESTENIFLKIIILISRFSAHIFMKSSFVIRLSLNLIVFIYVIIKGLAIQGKTYKIRTSIKTVFYTKGKEL